MISTVAFLFLVSAAPNPDVEPPAPRALSNGLVRSLFARCAGVVLTDEVPGRFLAKSPGRTVRVEAADGCQIHRPEKRPPYTVLQFGLETTDPVTLEQLSKIEREETFEGLADCDKARATHKLGYESARLCTEGFYPAPDVPVDLVVVLQPTFSALGPMTLEASPPGAQQVAWQVGTDTLRITGTSTCKGSRTIESRILGEAMRSYSFTTSFDLTNPAARTRLRSWRLSAQLLGINCEKALDHNKDKFQRDIQKAFTEVKSLLKR
ncbi:MAG: hypothetical protein Q8O67_03430 [Deltaproteobacteria bacterium]|nr:hypothetical protein [Deltaproteobacteria bacterium]